MRNVIGAKLSTQNDLHNILKNQSVFSIYNC